MTESITTMPSVLDWDRLREMLAAHSDLRPVGLRRVHIGASALDRLPTTVDELLAGGLGEVVLLRDDVAKQIGNRDLHAVVHTALGPVAAVRALVLAGDHGVVHADEATVERVVAGAAGAAVLVTVGSGTLTDLGKVAAAAHRVPHVVVQTAASVNGFADDQSVLLRFGVKRTVPSGWPHTLIIDADILAAAPAALNRAGVGDMLSMFTAPADWLLASSVGFPAGYHQTPVDLVRPHGDLLLSLAPKLAVADPHALAVLAELLTLSGVSMGAAGCTSPSSGMEHLISHLLDMHAGAHGRLADSHGAQVGVGSLVATAMWTRVRAALDAGAVDDVRLPDERDARRRVDEAFTRLDSTGRTAAECWSGYQVKLRQLEMLRPRLRWLVDNWAGVRGQFDRLLVDTARLTGALDVLGAPRRFADLSPGYPPDVARWAITNAHLMRDRFTIADLADLLGLGGSAGTEAVLADLDAHGAGL